MKVEENAFGLRILGDLVIKLQIFKVEVIRAPSIEIRLPLTLDGCNDCL